MDTRAQELIAQHRQEVDQLIDLAEADLSRGRLRSAAARVQSAARYAWYSHPGVFRDERMERLTAALGSTLAPGRRASYDVAGHLVHVATQAYRQGGHTRLIHRWMTSDPARTHSLVLTGQQGVPVPDELSEAVAASGGRVIDLGGSSDLMERARQLRGLAESAPQAIVLHIHPYDVVPSIALQDAAPPTVLLNHADHVFSLGFDVADLVADIRPAGQRLSLAARGVRPEQTTVLPLPLTPPPASSRAAARTKLGIPDDAVVLTSIASAYKFGAPEGRHFVDVHREVVRRHPNLHIVVAGPTDTGRWAELAAESDGRVRALGVIADVDDLYAAADIYIDSMPFASLTSLLDAALRGLPVLALTGRITHTVLSSDDISLAGSGVQFAEPEPYLRELEELITRADHREQVGAARRAAVAHDHVPPAWSRRVASLLDEIPRAAAGAPEAHAVAPIANDRATMSWITDELVRFQIASGLSEPVWQAQLRDAPYLPFAARVRLLSAAPRSARMGGASFLLPDALRSRIKTGMRRLRGRPTSDKRRRPPASRIN
ncbi:glycosyltransferase family 4 protein [Microbacterium sp. NPDC058021]|uniref:glycosyltransferase family 4 protein n=1 Tax=Microbacterium sp. NPDC058021 TaxID=3346306 RepID=UPI0036DB6DE6